MFFKDSYKLKIALILVSVYALFITGELVFTKIINNKPKYVYVGETILDVKHKGNTRVETQGDGSFV